MRAVFRLVAVLAGLLSVADRAAAEDDRRDIGDPARIFAAIKAEDGKALKELLLPLLTTNFDGTLRTRDSVIWLMRQDPADHWLSVQMCLEASIGVPMKRSDWLPSYVHFSVPIGDWPLTWRTEIPGFDAGAGRRLKGMAGTAGEEVQNMLIETARTFCDHDSDQSVDAIKSGMLKRLATD